MDPQLMEQTDFTPNFLDLFRLSGPPCLYKVGVTQRLAKQADWSRSFCLQNVSGSRTVAFVRQREKCQMLFNEPSIS